MDQPEWAQWPEEQLLEARISDLGLRLESSELNPLILQLYDELKAKGLSFLPPCHVGDEWFCPVGIPAIFIPFYLVHPRLRDLERKMMLEVEGDSPEWFMKLIRHEAGHAYAYAYQLFRKRQWQHHFGLTSTDETPDTYRPRPYSRSFVIHLDDWYAQSHPDEDFAETFAVWLTPGLNWAEEYKDWKALEKLHYVDRLMKSIGSLPPVHNPKYRVAQYNCLGTKLKTHYARKQKLFEENYPDFYDDDLKRLFATHQPGEDRPKAAAYLRKNRKALVDAVSGWTNEKKYRVNQLVTKLIRRAEALDLRVQTNPISQDLQVGCFITTLIMNYLFTGKFKRRK